MLRIQLISVPIVLGIATCQSTQDSNILAGGHKIYSTELSCGENQASHTHLRYSRKLKDGLGTSTLWLAAKGKAARQQIAEATVPLECDHFDPDLKMGDNTIGDCSGKSKTGNSYRVIVTVSQGMTTSQQSHVFKNGVMSLPFATLPCTAED